MCPSFLKSAQVNIKLNGIEKIFENVHALRVYIRVTDVNIFPPQKEKTSRRDKILNMKTTQRNRLLVISQII